MVWDLIWTEPAVSDLERIVRDVARHSSAAAEALRAELLESIKVLARFLRIGPTYERDRTGQTREILCRQYRVFYRVIEGKQYVEILAVWHSARREPKLPS